MTPQLNHIKTISARVEHKIYVSGSSYYSLVENKKEGTGNYFFTYDDELKRLIAQLRRNEIKSAFRPDMIVHLIKGLHGIKNIKKKEEKKNRTDDFKISRLRELCYVLSALNYLKLEKREFGRVYFIKQKKLINFSPSNGKIND